MATRIEIRESRSSDVGFIEEVYPEAFPDEDLLPVVRDLMRKGPSVLSLVATCDKTLAGHAMFTACGIAEQSGEVALLGPLAVHPDWQFQGVGSAIVQAGLRRLEDAGTNQVYVLGDPAYYGRFGFKRDDRVAPPYTLPEEWDGAWQSLSLRGGEPPLEGQLCVPQPWRQRALWVP